MAKHSPEVIKAAESITCQTYGSPVRVATGLGDKTCEGVADIIHRAMVKHPKVVTGLEDHYLSSQGLSPVDALAALIQWIEDNAPDPDKPDDWCDQLPRARGVMMELGGLIGKNPHNTGTQPPASKQTSYQRAFYAKTQGMIGLNCGPACGCCEDCNSIWDHEGIEPPEEQPTDEGGIGSMPCDTCGCSLQGDRYVAHYWSGLKPDQELHHISVCVDCLLYIVNGDQPEPEDWEGGDDEPEPDDVGNNDSWTGPDDDSDSEPDERETPAGTITIDGTTPEDYASRWGSTGPDGVFFYNYSSEIVEKTDAWLSEFIKAIDAQDREVRLRPDSYEPGDSLGLRVLRVCVYEQRKAQRQQQFKIKTD